MTETKKCTCDVPHKECWTLWNQKECNICGLNIKEQNEKRKIKPFCGRCGGEL